MKRRWVWVGLTAALIVLVGGGVYYTRGKTEAQPQRPRDPAFTLLLSIRTLERSPETRLSKEQIAAALPFVKALKDVPPSDAEAAAVIAKAVRDTFTPQQHAALEEATKRLQERLQAQGARPQGGFGGDGGSPGAGPGPGSGGVPGAGQAGGFSALTDEQRAAARTLAFDRMIRYLERRMK
jgi:hypothetical protein